MNKKIFYIVLICINIIVGLMNLLPVLDGSSSMPILQAVVAGSLFAFSGVWIIKLFTDED